MKRMYVNILSHMQLVIIELVVQYSLSFSLFDENG